VSALVDAHCHLADGAFDADRREVLARARRAGVAHIVVIGESIAASGRAVALAGTTPGLSATAGVHPHDATTWTTETEQQLRALLAEDAVVAVGETGLDYHYDHSPRPVQRTVFEAQLALAAELRRPVVVHAREADADLAAALRTWASRLPAIVLHSFSAGDVLFNAGLEVGAYFSFSGMVTFRSWASDDRLTACPDDRLLVETDAPYLAPVPHRGHRNEPAFVRDVFDVVARRRGVPLPQLAACVAENARRVFGDRLKITLVIEEESA
jgi:TatD DNase family protein